MRDVKQVLPRQISIDPQNAAQVRSGTGVGGTEILSFFPEQSPKLSKLDSSLEFDMERNHGAHVASRTVVIDKGSQHMTMDTVDSVNKRSTIAKDQPLRGLPHPFDKLHPRMYASELVGTALLVFLGLSIVIALWGRDAPLASLPISPDARRLLNGFLFGSVGAAIAYSPIGKISGAHINPAMTFAFWLEGKLQWRDTSGYVLAQLVGAAFGAVALLFWGSIGASDAWGASVPARSVPDWLPVAGETVCTFLLVLLIFIFAAHKSTQPFTPLVNPPLFALLTWLEAPLSGASANPARSFGPELVSSLWQGWWIYWIGPCLGAVLAVAVMRLHLFRRHRPHEARLCHFGHHGAT